MGSFFIIDSVCFIKYHETHFCIIINFLCMDYEFFEKTGLVLQTQGTRKSLFRYKDLGIKLSPVPFAQNAYSIDVYEDANLIVCDARYNTLDGTLIDFHTDTHPISIIKLKENWLILTENSLFTKNNINCFIWSGANILLSMGDLKSVVHSDKYVAMLRQNECHVYDYNANRLSRFPILENEQVFIYGDLIYCKVLGNSSLRSISKDELLKSNQFLLVCSKKANGFAMCSSLNKKDIEIYYDKSWRTVENVASFGLVDSISDELELYYIERNGKFFIYHFNGNRVYSQFENGLDYFKYNPKNGTLFIIADGLPYVLI